MTDRSLRAPWEGDAGAGPDSAWRWPEASFEAPSEFAEQVRRLLSLAAARGWREMVWCDASFADWPLGESAVVEALNSWAGAGRSLCMVAHHYDAFARSHARYVNWRRTWDHIVQCRAYRASGTPELPSAIWTPEGVLHRLDPLRSRGVCTAEPARRVALKQTIDECFQQGRPAFPASVLGL